MALVFETIVTRVNWDINTSNMITQDNRHICNFDTADDEMQILPIDFMNAKAPVQLSDRPSFNGDTGTLIGFVFDDIICVNTFNFADPEFFNISVYDTSGTFINRFPCDRFDGEVPGLVFSNLNGQPFVTMMDLQVSGNNYDFYARGYFINADGTKGALEFDYLLSGVRNTSADFGYSGYGDVNKSLFGISNLINLNTKNEPPVYIDKNNLVPDIDSVGAYYSRPISETLQGNFPRSNEICFVDFKLNRKIGAGVPFVPDIKLNNAAVELLIPETFEDPSDSQTIDNSVINNGLPDSTEKRLMWANGSTFGIVVLHPTNNRAYLFRTGATPDTPSYSMTETAYNYNVEVK